MCLPNPRRSRARGFTLYEVIGVLAIMAVLVCTAVPAIMRLVEDAKLVAEVQSIQAMRSAAETYFQQHGKFAGPNGAAVPSWTYNAYENWDRTTLLANGFAETMMRSRLATNAFVRLVKVTTTSTTANILTDIGTVGSISGFNGNNGYYNLTMQYTAVAPGLLDDLLLVRDGGRRPALETATRWLKAFGIARVAAGFAPFCSGLEPSAGQAKLRKVTGWLQTLRQVSWASRALRTGGSPVECCYPVPTTWPEPPPGFGGGEGDSHLDPGADTQIVAPDSSNPTIVVEVVLRGVSVQDAYRLSLAIDGPMQSNWAYWDSLGRVKYDMYNGSGGVTPGIVFVYLAHK